MVSKSRYESKAEVRVAVVFADLLLVEIRVFFFDAEELAQ